MTQVGIITAVILGIFQGFVEWLPISSSGQTILAMVDILKIDADTAFSLAFFLHFGTLLAVMLKLRGDVKYIVMRLPKYKEDKLVQFIVVSTIASTLVGLPVYIFLFNVFEGGIEGDVVTALVGFFLLLTGIIIYISKRKTGTRGIADSNAKDSLLAGLCQGFTVLPGLSRSGVTVAALVSKNFKQEEALRLSFLMSIPAIAGIMILEGIRGKVASIGVVPIVAGIIASFIIGYLMIDVLMRFAKRVKFDSFCVVFGIIAIVVGILVLM
ncbi:MAG: undecaprenyl-diphosphate phosphatase [Thermoplasmata archaeon]|nr:MAG: undecaprenyl-diphosphate phosphatase [Thermoplasmata archaeon]